MIEKEITKFEKEILLQEKIKQLENELKEKNCCTTTDSTVICVYHFQSL